VNLEGYRSLFVVGSLALILVAAFPGLSVVFSFPETGERFTELWLSGPGHMAADYPFNVSEGAEYLVYLGVRNHMGSSSFYNVQVKFRTQSEPLPNTMAETPSPSPTWYEYVVSVEEKETWETPLTFSFTGVSFLGNHCRLKSLEINGIRFDVDTSVLWDEENRGFYYQLLVELWIYQTESDTFEFHNRFVGIWLNMTSV
jgi:hypothetical protein